MKLELHNFKGIYSGMTIGLLCESSDARYHVWLKGDNTPGDVVFKNPPPGVEFGTPGHFRTRRLSSHNGQGKAILAALMAQAPALIEMAQMTEAQRKARERNAHIDSVVRQRKLDAAEAMFELLKQFVQVGNVSVVSPFANVLIEDIERPVPIPPSLQP